MLMSCLLRYNWEAVHFSTRRWPVWAEERLWFHRLRRFPEEARSPAWAEAIAVPARAVPWTLAHWPRRRPIMAAAEVVLALWFPANRDRRLECREMLALGRWPCRLLAAQSRD